MTARPASPSIAATGTETIAAGVVDPPPTRQARVILGAAIGLATGIGGLFFSTLAMFLKPIATEFHWSRTTVSSAVIVSMLGMVVGAPVLGRLIDRFGSRRVLILSIMSLGAGLLALSAMPAQVALFGLVSFLTGMCAAATAASGWLCVFPRWFNRRLGSAMAIAMVGVGVGAALLPLVARLLIEQEGWRFGYRVLAAVAVLAV